MTIANILKSTCLATPLAGRRIKLRVRVRPADAVPGRQVGCYRFLVLAQLDQTLSQLRAHIQDLFDRLYPENKGQICISRLQDDQEYDLDDAFFVSDLFDSEAFLVALYEQKTQPSHASVMANSIVEGTSLHQPHPFTRSVLTPISTVDEMIEAELLKAEPQSDGPVASLAPPGSADSSDTEPDSDSSPSEGEDKGIPVNNAQTGAGSGDMLRRKTASEQSASSGGETETEEPARRPSFPTLTALCDQFKQEIQPMATTPQRLQTRATETLNNARNRRKKARKGYGPDLFTPTN